LHIRGEIADIDKEFTQFNNIVVTSPKEVLLMVPGVIVISYLLISSIDVKLMKLTLHLHDDDCLETQLGLGVQ